MSISLQITDSSFPAAGGVRMEKVGGPALSSGNDDVARAASAFAPPTSDSRPQRGQGGRPGPSLLTPVLATPGLFCHQSSQCQEDEPLKTMPPPVSWASPAPKCCHLIFVL